MNIGGRIIGPGRPPYIIAEIGVNHDGSLKRALKLVEAAAEAGADAVKLQYFETDVLMSSAAKLAAYQAVAGETDPLAMLRRLELPPDAMAKIADCAHELGAHAIVTLFSVDHVGAANELPWDAWKTASPDIIHRPLLEALSATGKPLIVSTGASTLDEVTRAAGWLCKAKGRLAFLHCVSSYPAPDAALGGIPAIARATDLPTGYSDHTPAMGAGAAAVRAGALILEKHLTYDSSAIGPDHAASLEPKEFAAYVRAARAAAYASEVPPPEKRILDCERDVRAVSRQSVVARRPIADGQCVTAADLTIKRPGSGIPPFELNSAVIGRPAARDIAADVPLTWDDLADG